MEGGKKKKKRKKKKKVTKKKTPPKKVTKLRRFTKVKSQTKIVDEKYKEKFGKVARVADASVLARETGICRCYIFLCEC